MARALLYEESYHLGRKDNYQRVETRFVVEFTGNPITHPVRVEKSSITDFSNLILSKRSQGVVPVPKLPLSVQSVEWLNEPRTTEEGKIVELVMRTPLELKI